MHIATLTQTALCQAPFWAPKTQQWAKLTLFLPPWSSGDISEKLGNVVKSKGECWKGMLSKREDLERGREAASGRWVAGGRLRAEEAAWPAQGWEQPLNWLWPVSSGVHLKPSTSSVPEQVPAEGP